jgi:creatinine amidohydrolase
MLRMLEVASVMLALCISVAAQPFKDPDPDMQRPIDAYDSVFLEELTWLEVRDAMRAGKSTVIIAAGGVEENGPYLALGKHNYILQAAAEAIARKLGDALVAPIVAFVPEGNIDPPSSHMRYPGTISVRPEVFKALLTDIASSMKTHGFKEIVFLADSGGNVRWMRETANELAAKWGGTPGIHYIPEYYESYTSAEKYLESRGVKQVYEGFHDDFVTSALLMAIDPTKARMEQRKRKNKLSINGVGLATPRSIELGRQLTALRVELTIAAIRRARQR